MKVTSKGLLVPLASVPALYDALAVGTVTDEAEDEQPCHDCTLHDVRGLLCQECSAAVTREEAYGLLAAVMAAAMENAPKGAASNQLEAAEREWRKQVGNE